MRFMTSILETFYSLQRDPSEVKLSMNLSRDDRLEQIVHQAFLEIKQNVISKFLKDNDALRAHLLEVDEPLQFVLRGFLYIEAELITLVKEKFVEPDIIDLAQVRFETLLRLSVALGLLEKTQIHVYLKLNKIRNAFAHNLETVITKQAVIDLANTLTPDIRKDVDTAFRSFKATTPPERLRTMIYVLLMKLRHTHFTAMGPRVVEEITARTRELGLSVDDWTELTAIIEASNKDLREDLKGG